MTAMLALAALVFVAVAIAGSFAAAKGGYEPSTVLVSAGRESGPRRRRCLGRTGALRRRAIRRLRLESQELEPGAKSGRREIFVRDMATGAVTLASRADGAGWGGCRRRLLRPLDLRRRPLRRIRFGRGEPQRRGQRLLRHLRPRPHRRRDDAGLPRLGRRRARLPTASRATPRSPPTVATSPSSPTPTTSPPTRRPTRPTSSSATSTPTSPSWSPAPRAPPGPPSSDYSFEPSISADGQPRRLHLPRPHSSATTSTNRASPKTSSSATGRARRRSSSPAKAAPAAPPARSTPTNRRSPPTAITSPSPPAPS